MTFLHFADVHIGVETYGRIDPATGLNTRLQDFVKCLAFIVDTAIERRVDAALFVGDAYKNCDPTPTQQRLFAAQIRRLSAADIPVVMVPGNHDIPVAFGRSSSIDIFGVLDVPNVIVANRPDLRTVETRSGPLQVACLTWPTKSLLLTRDEYRALQEDELRDKILEICGRLIEDWVERLDPNVPAVLAAHVAAAEGKFSGSERSAMLGRDPAFLTSALANPAFDYVALGHLHRHQNLNPNGHPPIVYCGSPERVDFGEAREEKGFCLVQLEKGRATYEFIRTPARRFITVDVNADDPNATAIILAAIAQHEVSDAIVRVVYTISQEHAPLVDRKAIQDALAPAYLIAQIIPRTPETKPRQTRTALTETTSWREALDRYIAEHDDLKSIAKELKKYAEELGEELQQDEGITG